MRMWCRKVKILLQHIGSCGTCQHKASCALSDSIPSPTSSWYSGPVGCSNVLTVSDMRGTPAIAALYCSVWLNRGGGG